MKGGPQDLNGIMTEDKKTPQKWPTIYQNKIQRRTLINTTTTTRCHVIKVNGTCTSCMSLSRWNSARNKNKMGQVDFNADGLIGILLSFPTASVTSFVVFLPLPSFLVFPFDKTLCYAIICENRRCTYYSCRSIGFSRQWFKFVFQSRINFFSMSRAPALAKCSFSSTTQQFHVCRTSFFFYLQTSRTQHSSNLHDEILETLHIKLLS